MNKIPFSPENTVIQLADLDSSRAIRLLLQHMQFYSISFFFSAQNLS